SNYVEECCRDVPLARSQEKRRPEDIHCLWLGHGVLNGNAPCLSVPGYRSLYRQRKKMASSSSRPIYQDYIARIRYSNALPPPPNPPKLLEIPNTGLQSGHYTSAGFASRLHRDQPLNIEADAELGMPIDLVGLPGVFEGDESSEFELLLCTFH